MFIKKQPILAKIQLFSKQTPVFTFCVIVKTDMARSISVYN